MTGETLDSRGLAQQLRPILEMAARNGKQLSYAEAARALNLQPPKTIHRTAMALETLIAEDASNNRPLLACLVISRNREGLPAPGFFMCAAEHGYCADDMDVAKMKSFYRHELQKVIDYYAGST